jgi:TP53 regulating kinase-like protein
MAKRAHELCDENPAWELLSQGAEAKVWGVGMLCGREAVAKERPAKLYRHPTLDSKLTARRVIAEARTIAKCRRFGLDTPALLMVDLEKNRIFMERIRGGTVKSKLRALHDATAEPTAGNPYGDAGMELARAVGSAVARMHNGDVVHGDLTTSNFMLREEGGVVVIDFGLAVASATMYEDKAVDM